ncbi:hypothetical protein DAPPUDRAFT_306142 [Daphnia pulex]|uniref:Hydroxylysine kinase n=1 Tax=Daphnia pulex TaxID=6669 RepID=E9GVP7_DAPPU|nr:hypothetical protein DAPPUDRAFT_306142 [Daphnia pulex]|eukprot:EFX76488.1 hypothetical protein DAPPUDRAFT_306142 [Daphnia pulex]
MEKEGEILLKPGQQIKPHVPNEVVHQLVFKLYNLEVASVKELNSYDDKNFHVTVESDSALPDIHDACPHGYVLKVLNSLDSKAYNLIDAQNEMMLYLAKTGLPCPRPVKNVDGKSMSLEHLKDAQNQSTDQYIVRLLSFVPGKILFSVPYTKELFFQVGELVAKTDLALMGFKHNGLKGVDRIWSLIAVPKLVDFVYVIADEQKHSISMEVIENFKSNVIPFLQELESGPIHGDFNEQNILVEADKEDPEKYSISGMLDFGDVHFGYYLFDIAIAICYMMIECKSMDMLDAPGHVLAGYNRVRPIPQKEFDLLKDCISARFSQSLVLGAYSYSQNPDPYLLTTAQRGWQCLKTLWDCPKGELYKRWNEIINSYDNN